MEAGDLHLLLPFVSALHFRLGARWHANALSPPVPDGLSDEEAIHSLRADEAGTGVGVGHFARGVSHRRVLASVQASCHGARLPRMQ